MATVGWAKPTAAPTVLARTLSVAAQQATLQGRALSLAGRARRELRPTLRAIARSHSNPSLESGDHCVLLGRLVADVQRRLGLIVVGAMIPVWLDEEAAGFCSQLQSITFSDPALR